MSRIRTVLTATALSVTGALIAAVIVLEICRRDFERIAQW